MKLTLKRCFLPVLLGTLVVSGLQLQANAALILNVQGTVTSLGSGIPGFEASTGIGLGDTVTMSILYDDSVSGVKTAITEFDGAIVDATGGLGSNTFSGPTGGQFPWNSIRHTSTAFIGGDFGDHIQYNGSTDTFNTVNGIHVAYWGL